MGMQDLNALRAALAEAQKRIAHLEASEVTLGEMCMALASAGEFPPYYSHPQDTAGRLIEELRHKNSLLREHLRFQIRGRIEDMKEKNKALTAAYGRIVELEKKADAIL